MEAAEHVDEIPEGRADPLSSLIVACTPQTYMARFSPNGCTGDKPPLDVEHIFVDEAGYCNCMMSLALLANGVPVTFLGDHKQLPPVCTVDEEDLRRYISRGGFMRYGFLWSQSALFTESILLGTAESVSKDFTVLADPVFEETRRADLTDSHRFGYNLGEVLDRYVYTNGVRGLGKDPLEIICIDAVCGPRDRRVNRPEAEAVRAYLARASEEDYCILSPYRTQIDTLREAMPREEQRILTVHKSQGREWDTVILSVQDGNGCRRDVPLRFTSSLSDVGLKVINTAVSRAKKRLVIVCDRGFWLNRKDELICGLIRGDTCSRFLRWDGESLSTDSKLLNKIEGGYGAGESNGYKQKAEHRQEARP